MYQVQQCFVSIYSRVDVLWGQPIKFIQVASNSELRENQRNDLLFFEIVPCDFFGASEVQRVPALRAFWDLEKTVLHETRVSGTVLWSPTNVNSPTYTYISQKRW